MKKLRSKISLPSLILEFISVVFAVLLALGLNSYKQSKDDDNKASSLRSSIINECKVNQVKVDSVLVKNQAYFDLLDSLVRLDREDVHNVPFQYEFDLLTNAAWQIAQNDNSSNLLGQQFLLDASDIYQHQSFFMEFTSSFFENMAGYVLDQDNTPPYDMALALYFNMNVMFSACEELQGKYDKFLATYHQSN